MRRLPSAHAAAVKCSRSFRRPRCSSRVPGGTSRITRGNQAAAATARRSPRASLKLNLKASLRQRQGRPPRRRRNSRFSSLKSKPIAGFRRLDETNHRGRVRKLLDKPTGVYLSVENSSRSLERMISLYGVSFSPPGKSVCLAASNSVPGRALTPGSAGQRAGGTSL
jgi:hypothetical protein